MKPTDKELTAFALEGARTQLERIFTLFPQLRNGGNNGRGGPEPTPATSKTSSPRRKMSKAQRRLISERMTARWAERRAKAAKGAPKGARKA